MLGFVFFIAFLALGISLFSAVLHYVNRDVWIEHYKKHHDIDVEKEDP